jgi:hypothetical protein
VPRFVIHYKPAHLTFAVWNEPGDPHAFVCAYTIYDPDVNRSPEDGFPDRGFAAFKDVKEVFEMWLTSQVRTAIDEELLPDLWATASKGLAEMEVDPISTVGEFTEEERQQLKIALSTFRLRLIETFSPDEEQLKVISRQVDYLVAAVDRLKENRLEGCCDFYFDRHINHSQP